MIGFLEKLIGADAAFFEFFKFFLHQRRNIDVDTADILSVPARFVNSFDAVVYILQAAARVCFARHHKNALVSLLEQFGYFLVYFFAGAGMAFERGVAFAKSAVNTFIGANVGNI